MAQSVSKLMALVLFAIVTVSGCEVTAPPRGTGAAIPTTSQEIPRKSARAGNDRIAAAQTLFAAGNRTQAATTLDALDPSRLDSADQFAYYNLRAQLAIAVRDYPAAVQALSRAAPTNVADRNARALTAADLAEAQQSFEDAARELMNYSYAARNDDAAYALIVERTWTNVNRTPAIRISALASDSGTANAAWWQLADSLQRSFDLEAERTILLEWRHAHRDHPLNRWPPQVLSALESGSLAPPTQIALLLPLSGPLANAGQAVRDGFISAFYYAGSKGTVRVYDTNGAQIAALYEQALVNGAQLVVGPLDKQSVAELNALPVRRVPVLALNYLPPTAPPGQALVQFGLAIEDEARAIARRVYADGSQRVAVVESDTDWSSRALESFRGQFADLGGVVVTSGVIQDARAVTEVVGRMFLVDASAERVDALSKTIGVKPEFTTRRRSDVSALIAFTDPAQSRALNPAMAFHFASDVPIYATSQSAGSGSAAELDDLNGMRLTALPWQVFPSPVRQQIDDAFRNARPSAPLYALGVDAYRLSDRADLLVPGATGRLLGETGQLELHPPGIVVRDPAWAIVQHDALVALPTVVP